jgi:cyclopropane fatty-acyl-phospholipid synthase-like methyltransferase
MTKAKVGPKKGAGPSFNLGAKKQIEHFYDAISPLWKELWGIHVHHGYWRTGKESKELAQEQLTEELAAHANIRPGARILDVGCGMGGSSIYLARTFHAETVGVTLSAVQAEIATKAAKKAGVNSTFMVLDAEKAKFDKPFDVVWSIEAVSHFNNPESFFRLCGKVLKPGGVIAVMDWFEAGGLSDAQSRKFIAPIRRAMLVPSMTTRVEYLRFAARHGFTVTFTGDISDKVSKSWDLGMEIVARPRVWKAAMQQGKMLVDFLKGVDAMRKGFSTKSFEYGILIVQKMQL